MNNTFATSELLLGSKEFSRLSHERATTLDKETAEWLYNWEFLNLAWSPMDDEKRKFLRLGHYQGWFDRAQNQRKKQIMANEESLNEVLKVLVDRIAKLQEQRDALLAVCEATIPSVEYHKSNIEMIREDYENFDYEDDVEFAVKYYFDIETKLSTILEQMKAIISGVREGMK